MAIEVRIPTILRQYTGGAKAVEGGGDTWRRSSTTWSRATRACATVWSTSEGLRRFVNVYLNDEDVRFLERAEDTVSRR